MASAADKAADKGADKILVFVPAYNCAPQIGRVLAQFETVPRGTLDEILVLDNGSKDGTSEAACAAAAKASGVGRITVARNRDNYNLGGSHKAAFAYAAANGFSHVVVLHGDDQGDIHDLMPILERGEHRTHDACLGARFMPGSRLAGYSTFRIFGNHVFNGLFSIASRRWVYDMGSGLNVFSRTVFDDPLVERYADDLRFNVYLLLGLMDRRRRLLFFPISWREDDQISNVKMVSQSMKTLQIFFEYAFRRAFFRTGEHRAVVRPEYAFEVIEAFSPAAGAAVRT